MTITDPVFIDTNVLMLVHGIPRLLTHNLGDFRRFAHLVELLPLTHKSE